LGDVIYSAEERYYLIEVKGSRAGISSEWRIKDRLNSKLAYKSLSSLWEQLEVLCSGGRGERAAEDRDTLTRFFLSSFAAHHFAYWDEWENDQDKLGEIVLESYVPACARYFAESRDEGKGFIKPWPGNYFGFLRGMSNDAVASEVVGLSDIFSDRDLKVFISSSDESVQQKLKVGLPLQQFQKYVSYLVEDWNGEDESIFAVVLSNSGSFFKVIGSTKELKLLMDPKSDLYSSPRKKPAPYSSFVSGRGRVFKLGG